MGQLDEEKQTLLEVVPKSANIQRRPSNFLRLVLYKCLAILALISIAYRYVDLVDEDDYSCDDPDKGFVCRPDISRYWGQYSPYFAVPSEIKDEIPEGCRVTFVNVLSRHGARHPTLTRTIKYSTTFGKLQATAQQYPGKYAFLRKYKYGLGADQLNDFGRQEMFHSGSKAYKRYKHLAKGELPFIRASGQQRVVDSGDKWMEGYHEAKLKDEQDDIYPYPMLILPEGPTFNNSLNAHQHCDNIENGPLSRIVQDAKDAWENVFLPPIAARLRSDLGTDQLNEDDAHNIMSMCPFDTVNKLKGRPSKFCDLFSIDEWRQYNHLQSLDKFYGWAAGNPLGPSQGVGFVNELIARMTNQTVHDHTSTNQTLNADKDTFPLNRKFYADFSHDNDLTSVFYAVGLFQSVPMLSITKVDSIEYTKGWSSAWTVPFSARAYFEKMQCGAEDEELVRVVINDRVVPLELCHPDELGRCKLSDFVDSLTFAKSGGSWEQCFFPEAQLEYELPSTRSNN